MLYRLDVPKETAVGWSEPYWPMVFGPIMIAVIICITLMMVFIKRSGMLRRSRDRAPIDVLKERLARGEINQAEYEERTRLLKA
jgi:putative membrane protein